MSLNIYQLDSSHLPRRQQSSVTLEFHIWPASTLCYREMPRGRIHHVSNCKIFFLACLKHNKQPFERTFSAPAPYFDQFSHEKPFGNWKLIPIICLLNMCSTNRCLCFIRIPAFVPLHQQYYCATFVTTSCLLLF